MQLTQGDIEVFRWLWMLRLLTIGQIRRLRYYQPESGNLSAFDNVRKRLKKLADEGYLSGDTLLDTSERIYSLAEKALGPLREVYGIDQRRLFQPRGQESLTSLRHPLMVSEIATRIVESIRGTDYELADLEPLRCPFVHTHAIGDASKKRHVARFVSQCDLRTVGHIWRIRPDLVFGIRSKEGIGRLYFVEADRGFEAAQEIAEKLHGYHLYFHSPDEAQSGKKLWEKYGEFGDFRVLLVTTTGDRVRSLARATGSKPGGEMTAMTTLLALQEENALLAGIWTNAQGMERALLKSRNTG